MKSGRDRMGAAVGLAALASLAGCVHTSVRPATEAADAGDPAGASATLAAVDPAIDGGKVEAKRAKLAARGPKRTDQPQEAMDFFMQQRLAPGMSSYPIERVMEAAAEYRAARVAAAGAGLRGGNGLAGEWVEVGPGNIGGRTRAVVVDPTNTDIIYAAGVAGGVFKTIDGGQSWVPTSDSMVNLAVSSLVMDPNDPLTLYAGTGEGYFNGDSVQGLGIFKTTDGGVSWSQLPGTVEPAVADGSFEYVNKMAISPNDSNRLYAATRHGVWRSTDGGANWSLRLANPVYASGTQSAGFTAAGAVDLDIRQDSDPDVLLACFGSFSPDGLYRSTNGGDSWTKVSDPDVTRFDQGRMVLDIAPSNNNVMYICMANNGASAETGRVVEVLRSTDGGATWEPRLAGGNQINPLLLTNIPFASGCFGTQNFSQGWYDNIIRVDPANPDVVFVGGIDLTRSDDGGRNFRIASYWYIFEDLAAYAHADHHEIVFHPDYDGVNNQTMWIGTDGGVFRTDNARASTTLDDCPQTEDDLAGLAFTALNNGYGVTQFYHGEVSRTDDLFLGGTQDNGTNFVASRETPNSWTRVFGGDGGYVAFDPRTNNRYYLETQRFANIRRTDDNGASFVNASNGLDDDGLFIVPFTLDPSNPDRLWTGGQRIWRTTNRGDSWSQAGPNLSGPATVSAIAVAPSDPSTVYVGYSDGFVAVSRNAGAGSPSWDAPSDGLPTEEGFISSVAVDPENPDIAYATVATFGLPHVYKTTDGGDTWSVLDGGNGGVLPDVPAHWIAVRPSNTQHLFVGTEVGVFESENGGGSWFPAGQGLPATVCESLTFRDDDTLVVFTHGRGTFVTALSAGGGGEPQPCNAADLVEPFELLDLADITAFVSAFSNNQPAADLDDNGLFDLVDISAFVAAFLGGCP